MKKIISTRKREPTLEELQQMLVDEVTNLSECFTQENGYDVSSVLANIRSYEAAIREKIKNNPEFEKSRQKTEKNRLKKEK